MGTYADQHVEEVTAEEGNGGVVGEIAVLFFFIHMYLKPHQKRLDIYICYSLGTVNQKETKEKEQHSQPPTGCKHVPLNGAFVWAKRRSKCSVGILNGSLVRKAN